MTRAPVDRTEIRQLAADPEVILTIKVIDDFFNGLLRACPEQAEKPGIEDCWSLIKKGLLRLYDPEIDEDDDMIIREAATPGQRQRARIEGAKLFAVRQHIKRQVREAARRRMNARVRLSLLHCMWWCSGPDEPYPPEHRVSLHLITRQYLRRLQVILEMRVP